MQRGQQATGGFRNFLDGTLERRFVGLRGLVEAGKLAHELQRRGMDFILTRRRIEINQRLDVAAHRLSPLPGTALNTSLKDDRVTQIATSPHIFVIEWAVRLSQSCDEASSFPCPTSPTRSSSTTAAGPIPPMAYSPNRLRPMPRHLPPQGALLANSGCPAAPSRSSMRLPTASDATGSIADRDDTAADQRVGKRDAKLACKMTVAGT